MQLKGFRVSGCPPRGVDLYVSADEDMFVLPQAAVECAESLVAAGWTEVTCTEIHVHDSDSAIEGEEVVVRVLYPKPAQ